MGALAISDLRIETGDARVADRRLAEALGFAEVGAVRRIIERHKPELSTHGVIGQTDHKPSFTHGVLHQSDAKPRAQGGRPVRTYWLNEAQAVLVCMFARTPKAAEVRRQVITVFLAWRHGELVAAPQPTPLPPAAPSMSRKLSAMVEGLSAFQAAIDFARENTTQEQARGLVHLPIWGRQKPYWWWDQEVRAAAYACHGLMNLDMALAGMRDRFGPERVPSRSALSRFYQKLDGLRRP